MKKILIVLIVLLGIQTACTKLDTELYDNLLSGLFQAFEKFYI